MKKYIGTKQFYIAVFSLIIPIMLQQLFVSLAGYVDSLMVNNYGGNANAYNGVSAANRLIFVFNFAFMGLGAAASVFISQFFGAGKDDKVKETIRISLLFSIIFGIISLIIMIICGNRIIDLFIQNPESRKYGYDYLYYLRFGIILMVVNTVLANTFRNLRLPKVSLFAAVMGIIANIFFNYCLIYGNFGFKELGASGASIGTVISKIIEFSIFIIVLIFRKEEYFKGLFKIFNFSKQLIINFIKKGMPLILNELCWALGMILVIKFYTYKNDLWYNAYAYSQNISDLFFIVFSGLGTGIAVFMGNTLGQGKFDKALKEFNWFRGLSLLMGITLGLLMAISSPFIVLLFNPEPETKILVIKILRVTSIFITVYCFTATNFFTLRAGGDTVRAFIVDQSPTYFICLPIAIILGVNAQRFSLTVVEIYFIAHLSDVVKLILGNIFIKQKKWLKNLTTQYS